MLNASPRSGVDNYFNLGATLRRPCSAESCTF